jgi:hypothetical protein
MERGHFVKGALAVEELQQTTMGWNRAKNLPPAKLEESHWGPALEYLEQIGDVEVPLPALFPSTTLYPSDVAP